jgi:uncharacterized protein YceK
MKKIVCFLAIVLIFSSCTHVTVVQKPKNAPPGQVKKVTGSQSAKPYAPGQQKKKL